MRKYSRIPAVLLIMALLVPIFAGPVQVRGEAVGHTAYNADPENLSYVTEAEDQAYTNYCWAYMADAVLESFLWRTGRAAKLDLSETDMIYRLGGGGIYGFTDLISGGSYHQAVGYWTRGLQQGPRLESDGSVLDYYVSRTVDLGECQNGDEKARQEYIQQIKSLVVQYGAAGVSVYFNAYDRSQTTQDGAYYYPRTYCPGVNHGVAVVGWNDNFPSQWFYNSKTVPHQPRSNGAFLVKNSWGKDDRDSINSNTGCYWISYENYFQDAFAVAQVLDRGSLYDHIYETDYRGLAEYAAGNSYRQTYMLSSGTQLLSGFATYVKAGASYRFYVNGRELTQFAGTMPQSGYRTFRLAEPVKISGTIVELRVEVTGTRYAVPVSSSAENLKPDTDNICLKLFTVDDKGAADTDTKPPAYDGTITGVTVTPQDCTVCQGEKQVFTAKVLGTGQTPQQISWQLSGNSSEGTRLENGVLYVDENEASSELYVYANSSADAAKSAAARVAVVKSAKNTSYTVTFISEGEICSSQRVASGEAAQAPVLEKKGYLLSWDKDFQNITGDLVVKAVWTEMPADPGTNSSGGTVQVDKAVYTCLADGTARYTKCNAKSRYLIKIPATVQLDSRSYEVTALEESCILKNRKVSIVTIGKNVAEIGKNAFYGCSKLKKIKIKSDQVEYIGSNAFQGIASGAVIYVPEGCLSEYRAMVRASGNAKVKVKEYS